MDGKDPIRERSVSKFLNATLAYMFLRRKYSHGVRGSDNMSILKANGIKCADLILFTSIKTEGIMYMTINQ